MNLQRGMRDKLDKYLNVNQPIEVTMDVRGNDIYEYFCLGADSAGKLTDDRYLVFYNQVSSPKDEITYKLSGFTARFTVDLGRLPSSIQKLAFTVGIKSNGTMGEISSLTVTVHQRGGEDLVLALSGSDFRREKAITAVEVYRKDVWRIAAVANGFNGGMGDLLQSYGGKELPARPEKENIPDKDKKKASPWKAPWKAPSPWKGDVDGTLSQLSDTGTVPGHDVGPKPHNQTDQDRNKDSEEALKMIYKATKLIQTQFKDAGIKCNARELGNFSMVEAAFTGKNCNVTIRFVSVDNGNGVKALTDNFAKYSKQRLAKGYEIVNSLNQKYKYAKFTMTKDGDICAEYDFPTTIKEEAVGTIAVEIVLRFAQIVDEAYPEIMQSVWS